VQKLQHRTFLGRYAEDPSDTRRVYLELQEEGNGTIVLAGDPEPEADALERKERVKSHLAEIFAELGYGDRLREESN
jgi:hypothetical protein